MLPLDPLMGWLPLVIHYGLMSCFWVRDFSIGQKSIPLKKQKQELFFLR